MKNPLKDVRLKIQRANKHISDLHRKSRQFFSGQIYTIAVDVDPKSGDKLAKIKLTEPIPCEFALIIGDCLSNLRTSLDYLAGAVARTKTPNAKRIKFPFAGSLNAFQCKRVQRQINALPPAARPIIESLKPYKGGNDLLWAVSGIRNDDSHNFIVPVGSAGDLVGAEFLEINNAKVGLIISGPGRLDEGIVISNLGQRGTIKARPGFEEQANLHVAGEIAFGDVEVVGSKPAVATLDEMRNLIKGVVSRFEIELFS